MYNSEEFIYEHIRSSNKEDEKDGCETATYTISYIHGTCGPVLHIRSLTRASYFR